MSNNKAIRILRFLFRQEWLVLSESLKSNPSYEAQDVDEYEEVIEYLKTEKSGLIIASLTRKEDLIPIATLVKLLKKIAKETTSKIVIVNFSGDPAFEKAMSKLGIMDILNPHINNRALKFKLDFWMKALSAQLKKQETRLEAQRFVSDKETKKSFSGHAGEQVEWCDPIECEDDVWLTKNDEDCKKVLTKFLIHFIGPGPYAGQWVLKSKKDRLWRFEFKENAKSVFLMNKGDWYFRGEQIPEFLWKENRWLFTGTEFELFYQVQDIIITRAKASNKVLTVSRNSEYAKTKEELIVESFDKEITFKKEASYLDNLEGKGEAASRFRNLEGEGKISTFNHSHLKGKLKNDHLSSGLLAYQASGLEDGKNLDLETKQKVQKHYKGHNEAEQYEGRVFGDGSEADKLKDHYSGVVKLKNTDPSDKNEEEGGTVHSLEEASRRKFKNASKERQLQKETEEVEEDLKVSLDEADPQLKDALENAIVTAYLFQKTLSIKCVLDDHFDKTILFTTPQRGLRSQSPVSIDLNFKYMKKEIKLKLEAMITKIEQGSEGIQYITVEFGEERIASVASFMKLYQLRQKNVNYFIKTVKGL